MSDERARLKKRARALESEGLSIRQIAEALGVGKSTVDRWLKEPRRDMNPASLANLHGEDGKPVAGAEPGNQRRLTHGAYSDAVVRPEADALISGLLENNPHLALERDGAALLRYAMTLVRIERVWAWLDQQSDPVFSQATDGEVHGVYQTLDAWERRASRDEERLGIAPLTRVKLGLNVARGAALAAHLRERYGNGGGAS